MPKMNIPFSTHAVPIISDIHGHAEGLLKVLAHIKALGIRNPPLVCGDLIWTNFFKYDPVRVLDILMDMPLAGIVAGNTDIAMIDGSLEKWAAQNPTGLKKQKDMISCKRSLNAAQIEFLYELPTHFQFDFGGHLVLMTHASPTSQHAGLDLDLSNEKLAARFDCLITGHLHLMFSRQLPGQRMHFNVGAVGKHPHEYNGTIDFTIMDRSSDGMIFIHNSIVD